MTEPRRLDITPKAGIDFSQEIKTITGQPIVDGQGKRMTLRSFCIEMLCASEQGKQESSSDRIKNGCIAARLVESEELKDGDLSRIIEKVKQFASTAAIVPVLKALGVEDLEK